MLDHETSPFSFRSDVLSAALVDRTPPRRSLFLSLTTLMIIFGGYRVAAEEANERGVSTPALQFGTNAFHHVDGVSRCVFSPNGKKVFSFGYGGVRGWDVASGKQVSRLDADTKGIGFCISTDGRLVAFQRASLFVDVFDIHTGKTVSSLFTHSGASVREISFAADDRVVLVATRRALFGFDLATGRTLWEVPYRGTFAMQGGRNIAAMTDGAEIILLDALTGKPTKSLAPFPNAGNIVSMAFSADANVLAVCWQETPVDQPSRFTDTRSDQNPYFVSTYRVDTGRIEFEVAVGKSRPYRLAMSPDRRWLAVRDTESLTVYDLVDPENRTRLVNSGGGYPLFSPDGKRLIAAAGCVIAIWTVDDWQRVNPGHLANVRFLSISEDHQLLATSSCGGMVCIWNLATGQPTATLSGEGETNFIDFLPGGDLVTAHANRLVFWDLDTNQARKTVATPFKFAGHWTLSGDGALLAAVDEDTIWIWDVAKGNLIHTHRAPNRSVGRGWFRIECPAFSPGGTFLAFEEQDRVSRRLIVLDVSTGRAAMQLDGQPDRLGALTFSPDGGLLLATGGSPQDSDNPGKAVIWELATRTPVLKMVHPYRSVQSVRFIQGGQAFQAYGSNRGYKNSVRIFALPDGAEIATPRYHWQTGSVRFQADAGYVLASGPTAQLWHAPPENKTTFPQQSLSNESFSRSWEGLTEEPERAFQATLALARRGEAAVAFLASRQDDFVRTDAGKVKRLLSKLRSISASARESARLDLCELGPSALMILEKAYEDTDSEEVRRPLDEAIRAIRSSVVQDKEELRRLRAVRALRMIGTPDAVALADSL